MPKRIGMEHIKFKQVSIEDLYTSIIKATRVIDDRGWTGMQPIARKHIDTGNEFMDAIGKLLAENCHIRTYELAQSIGVSKEWYVDAIYWDDDRRVAAGLSPDAG